MLARNFFILCVVLGAFALLFAKHVNDLRGPVGLTQELREP